MRAEPESKPRLQRQLADAEQKLARAWLSDTFGYEIIDAAPPGWDPSTPFTPPAAKSRETTGLELKFWAAEPAGKTRERTYTKWVVTLGPDGGLVVATSEQSVTL